MNLDALIRSVTLQPSNYMLFVGAGASVTSGVPSAQDCIWRWKRLLYLTSHPKVNPVLLGSASLPHVQARIQSWLDRVGGHPALGTDEEYSHYVEACFPRSVDRRAEFAQLLRTGKPHIGYRLLGLLMDTGKFRWVWTTNFDDLVERGRPDNRSRTFLQAGLDTTHRLDDRSLDGVETVEVFLHGDYRYDDLRNTNDELRSLDQSLRAKLAEAVERKPLLVVGYSGRDASIMDALTEAYSAKSADLFWCAMDTARLSPRVEHLLNVARRAGNIAEAVPFEGFDDLMERLARLWLTGAHEQAAVEHILTATSEASAPFRVPATYAPDNDWILGNAFEIELPRTIFEITGGSIPNVNAWQWVRETAEPHRVSAGLFKGIIVAVGRRADVEAFASSAGGQVRQVEVAPGEVIRNSAMYAAVLGAVVGAIQGEFDRVGRYSLAERAEHSVRYANKLYQYVDALQLSLERVGSKDYLTFQLDIRVDGQMTDDERKAVKREVLWRQRNKEYFEKLKGWKAALFRTDDGHAFTFPPATDDGPSFRLDRAGPIVARLFAARPKPLDPKLVRQMSRFERFKAVRVEEPLLNFSSGKSVHPIRGLTSNGGPFDANDPTLVGDRSVRIAVLCTAGYERRMESLLAALTISHEVGAQEADREYLVRYPGFEQAFSCPLRAPLGTNDQHWRVLPRIDASQNPQDAFGEIAGVVRRALEEAVADAQVDVVLIHVPPEWGAAERIVINEVVHDLHDHIKAIAIQRGIRTQLLRDSKLGLVRDARLNWWLSLALYTKAMRTPWSLDHPSKNVAYVGIGYSYSGEATGDPIVLGCSHVFDSTGLGLRFRLGKLKEPIWRSTDRSRRKSPFMSRDDAALLGNRTRQLFYEIHQRLPDRVLVTKRTPFLQSERDGLLTALSDVPEVDLVSVEADDSWRCCAYNAKTKEAHGFPVRRGSVVLLDSQRLLLWLHGSVMEVVPGGLTYYQGKSRIPIPVRVTRFSGASDAELIATDLLALTKMDWNTFALYRKMPVTVTSPNVIARIGRLLSSGTAESYDYRLFM